MIAICLNLVLITLLLLAVWIGVRLEKRLKLLRGSQEGFVGAVAELNAGVDKAQAGLSELKMATLEARTELADRIQDAKGMTARLERQAAAAEQAVQRLEAMIEKANALPPPSRGRDQGRGAEPLTLRSRAERPAAPEPTRGEGALSKGPDPRWVEEQLVLRRAALSQPPPPPAERGRARIVDEDLFDRPLSLGGRR